MRVGILDFGFAGYAEAGLPAPLAQRSFGAGSEPSTHGTGCARTIHALAPDAGLLLANAMPAALKKGQPGTLAFRKGLRDALEAEREVAGAHGVFNMSANDHFGLDERARVLVRVQGGEWKVLSGK